MPVRQGKPVKAIPTSAGIPPGVIQKITPKKKFVPPRQHRRKLGILSRAKARAVEKAASRRGQFGITLRALQRRKLGRYLPDEYLLHQLGHLQQFPDQVGQNIRSVAKRRRLNEISRESRRINRCH
jgi:hypothetical protein